MENTRFKVGEEKKVKEILEEESEAWHNKRSELYELSHGQIKYFYASSVFQCPRKIWYEFKGGRPKFSSITCRIFHNGEAVHERLCTYLRNSKKVKLQEEVPIESIIIGDTTIHGRIDGWITFIDTNKDHLLEFKSINAESLLRPKIEHVAQLNLYMGASSVKTGSVVYESKRNNQIFEFEVDFNQELYDDSISFFRGVKEHIDEDIIPVVDYKHNKYPCSWRNFAGKCPHYDKCWGKGIKRT